MPATPSNRDEILDSLIENFRNSGYDGASLSDLSNSTRLGKSSLYHYFPGGKQEMAEAVLLHAGAWLTDRALAVLRGPGTPHVRLQRMLSLLREFYKGGKAPCIFGSLSLGSGSKLFHAALSGSFESWIEAIAALLREARISRRTARERAETAVIRIQGCLIVSAGLGDTGPFERTMRSLGRDLLTPERC